MTAVHIDDRTDDAARRTCVYEGDLVVLEPTSASLELAAFAREMVEEAFAPFDPTVAQHSTDVEEWVRRFAPVKPAFIHHERTATLLPRVLGEAGCDLADTYFDVPRLRGVTSDGYLTSGVGYAHHPHRDTWYAAPLCQLNWWMPLYPFESGSAMAFYPSYFARAVANGSADFDYYRWNADGRPDAAKHIHSDTRRQPKATEPLVLDPDVRIVPEVGSLLLFSAEHLHGAVPNHTGRTRFSIDFRTVSESDLRRGLGAPNVDSAPSGTSLRDFRRCRDAAPMPPDLVARHDTTSDDDATRRLVFRPRG